MAITPIGVYLLYFIFSHPDSQLCVPEDRNIPCPIQNSHPVCATYECQSITGFCQRTIRNSCLACQETPIIGYVLGDCKDSEASQLCRKGERHEKCDQFYDSEDYEPACGYATTTRLGGHDVYAQTWSSKCAACSQSQVTFHIPGECKDINTLNICKRKQKSVEECSEKIHPICAYYTGGDCEEKLCKKTERSPCLACADTSVLFYVNSACMEEEEWIDEEESIEEEEEGVDFGLSAFYDSDDSDDVIDHLGETLLDDVFYEEEEEESFSDSDSEDDMSENVPKKQGEVEINQDDLDDYKKYVMEELKSSYYYGA